MPNRGAAFPSIVGTPGVRGDEPCLVRTGMPAWVLVQARHLGAVGADLPRAYPTLRAADSVNAWAYYRANRSEIDAQSAENEAA